MIRSINFKMLAATLLLVTLTALPALAAVRGWALKVQNGGARLFQKQNGDGGWGWDLDGASSANTIGPIGTGLAKAYQVTLDANQLTALQKVKTYLLAKISFSTGDGQLAAQLDAILGGTECRDFMRTNYYNPMAAGTYNHHPYNGGTAGPFTTAGYIAYIS